MKFGWPEGWNKVIFEEPLYFEDFHPDLRFNSLPWATIAASDIICFGLITGDKNALHFDGSFAANSILGGLAVHGELVANTLFGALHYVNFWNKSLGALCEKYVKFVAPVRPGEAVKHFLRVLETRELKSYPAYGFVKFEFFTENQKYERVAEGWFSVILRKKNIQR